MHPGHKRNRKLPRKRIALRLVASLIIGPRQISAAAGLSCKLRHWVLGGVIRPGQIGLCRHGPARELGGIRIIQQIRPSGDSDGEEVGLAASQMPFPHCILGIPKKNGCWMRCC
jgi:hypothetical protein